MKRYFTISILMLSSVVAYCQANYSFSFGTAAYQPLQNAWRLNNQDSISDQYYLNIHDSFPLFGAYSNFTKRLPGGLFISKYGIINTVESPAISYAHTLYPYFASLRRIDSNSALLVDTGLAGSRLIKVEWRHMGIEGAADSLVVNFQCWLEKNSGSISYHYGPAKLGADTVYSGVGISRAHASNLNNWTHASFLSGSLSAQSLLTTEHPSGLLYIPNLFAFPANGTVINLHKTISGMPEKKTTQLSCVYPNPFKEELKLRCEGPFSWSLMDMTGREIMQGTDCDEALLLTGNLHSGVYFIQLETAAGKRLLKLIRE